MSSAERVGGGQVMFTAALAEPRPVVGEQRKQQDWDGESQEESEKIRRYT